MFVGILGFLTLVVYIAVVVYFFVLLSRLVSAVERMSQNVEIGVAAWSKNLRQQSGGSAQQLPPT